MSLLRATFADARSPIIGGLGAFVPAEGPRPIGPVAPFDNVSLFGPMTALSEIPLNLGPFDNVSEFGPGDATATVEAAPFDNVNEFGGVELIALVDAAPFDNASGFGGVTVDIEVAVDAAPFDNVSEYGGFTLSTDVLAAPFDDASAVFGGITIDIDVNVSAAPFDNAADHKFGPTEYCIATYPGFETTQTAFVTATSGTETYTDVFGRAPDAGDLLLFIVLAQNVAFTPTITGFTLVSTITAGGTACVALFTRLATGAEGSTISYSGWTGASGTDWDFAGGIIVPDGEHFGTADSDTVQATASVTTGDTSPAISTSWGAVLMNAYSAIVTAGSTTPIPVPSGYTQRFLQNFASGDTARRVAIASKAVDGDSETPGAWNTTGTSLTWAVRGPHGPCTYGGLEIESPPFDNVTEFGGVFVGSEVPIFSAPFDNASEYGGINIEVEMPITVPLYEFDNFTSFGGATYETYPIVYSSAATVSVEDADSTHAATLPLAGSGEFYVMIIAHTGATPSVAGFTLVSSIAESGGIPGMAIFKRVVTGSEGSTATVTTDVGATCIDHVFNIIGSENTLDVALASATKDPPSVSFTEPYNVAITATAMATSGQSITADPVGYTLVLNTSNDTGQPMDLRSARKGSISSSPENPTQFSSTVSSSNHVSCTIVVHGRDQSF